MRDAATDGAPVPDLPVSDERRGEHRERPPLRDERRDLELVRPCHRTEDEAAVVVLAHVRQVADPIEIDQQRGLREAKGQQRHQTLAAGEQLRLVAAGGEGSDRLLDRGRCRVLELGRLHRSATAIAAAAVRIALMMFT